MRQTTLHVLPHTILILREKSSEHCLSIIFVCLLIDSSSQTLESSPFRFVRLARPRVRTGPVKPGKSWNFILALSRAGKSWKKATGPGKFWKFVKLN